MTGRSRRSNLFTRGLGRLVADVGSGVIDTALELAASARNRYAKDEPAQVHRPADWWNTPATRTKLRL